MFVRHLRGGLCSFPQEVYRDFATLIDQISNEEFQGGGIVEISASDSELVAVMSQYLPPKPSWRA
ncbi:hypothetical protein I7I49_18925 [Sinorhizobium meliloti]|uniref:hypothetical protein n=1 Tax=Rhizobium meliloti TaxID=382 RepID=UPI00237F2A3E|nr:hypothetical protein [Sinorhizobium meliloti]MDE3812322.1 hypothetical protein [Sinorhizobium meliloti]